jgi:molybdopterin-synthase adenylyltransferase
MLPQRDRLATLGSPRGRVLVVGAGGLGCPAALSLAAAGVAALGLIDCDCVDASNLQRQILYRTADLGRCKAEVAAERIVACYPEVSVQFFAERLSADNLARVFRHFDFIIDGTDQIAAKYLVNDGAVLLGIPFSHAGILGFQGQTMTILPGRSACLRCVFPSPPPAGPTCQDGGVIGAVCGTIGAIQAAEAIKYLFGLDHLLTDRLLTYDALSASWRTIAWFRSRTCPVCGDHPTIQRIQPIETTGDTCG